MNRRVDRQGKGDSEKGYSAEGIQRGEGAHKGGGEDKLLLWDVYTHWAHRTQMVRWCCWCPVTTPCIPTAGCFSTSTPATNADAAAANVVGVAAVAAHLVMVPPVGVNQMSSCCSNTDQVAAL